MLHSLKQQDLTRKEKSFVEKSSLSWLFVLGFSTLFSGCRSHSTITYHLGNQTSLSEKRPDKVDKPSSLKEVCEAKINWTKQSLTLLLHAALEASEKESLLKTLEEVQSKRQEISSFEYELHERTPEELRKIGKWLDETRCWALQEKEKVEFDH